MPQSGYKITGPDWGSNPDQSSEIEMYADPSDKCSPRRYVHLRRDSRSYKDDFQLYPINDAYVDQPNVFLSINPRCFCVESSATHLLFRQGRRSYPGRASILGDADINVLRHWAQANSSGYGIDAERHIKQNCYKKKDNPRFFACSTALIRLSFGQFPQFSLALSKIPAIFGLAPELHPPNHWILCCFVDMSKVGRRSQSLITLQESWQWWQWRLSLRRRQITPSLQLI